MDKQIENEMYEHSFRQLHYEVNSSHKRKVQLTRNLKLSSSENDITQQERGGVLQNEGQLQKSLLPFKKATIINPHNESAQLALMKTLFELEKENEAFSCMKKNLSLNPNSSCFHELLIQMFQKKCRLEDFESFSNEIVDMIADPELIPSFYFASAQAWLDRGDSAQALLACQKAMKNNLLMGESWRCLYGKVLQHEGLYEEALVQFKQVRKCLTDGELGFIVREDEEHVINGVAYMTYCLGGAQTAKEEFEKIIAERSWTGLIKWSYFLMLCHLGDEKMIKHYKGHEFREWFPIPKGNEWIRFYEQELKITQKILQRGDLDENTKKFNTKKLKALNVMLPFLKERVAFEEERSILDW